MFRYIRTNNKPWHVAQYNSYWFWKNAQGNPFTGWNPIDGAILGVTSEEQASILGTSLEFPLVNTYAAETISTFPQVDANAYNTGKMAAEYFLRKGFRSFLCLETPYSPTRCRGFQETLQALGINSQRFSLDGFSAASRLLTPGLPKLVAHLRKLPKPVALYCEHDPWAQSMITILRHEGLHVPNDVAVLGTQNEDIICESTLPNISSIALPYEEVGYEAARILDNLLHGGKPPTAPIRLEPIGVVERQSTEILAVPNPNIKKAITYIKKNACGPIKVEEIARASGRSLRVLQKNFRSTLGYSLQDEIQRVRIVRAKNLLLKSKLNLDEIAEKVGFIDKSYLGYAFRKRTGITPGNYRKQFKT